MTNSSPLLEVKDLHKNFTLKGKSLFKKKVLPAVNGVNFTIFEGETLGLVGESGCGKSTTGRTILQLIPPTKGEIIYKNKNLVHLSEKERKAYRKDFQMIFQDPFSSFNPKQKIGQALIETMQIHQIGSATEQRARALELLVKVGFTEEHFHRYPHEFSGGQRQRLAIARALMTKPKFIVCDEAVSALDVSIQAQVLNLLKDIQREMGVAYLFISHDLNVVRYISDRIAVMYQGEIVEIGTAEEIFTNPTHPYTKKLLQAILIASPTNK